MENNKLTATDNSPYNGCCMVLTTKHQKSIAVGQPIDKVLHAGVLEYVTDTDKLGTFSCEIERQGTTVEIAKKKCELGIIKTNAEYALSSEGSFGPHPIIPFAASNIEVLYFIDRKRNFELFVTETYVETNYNMSEVYLLENLFQFAEKVLFPSHALIVRATPKTISEPIFKGIKTKSDLEAAFLEAKKISPQKKVWVETDMRAHLNPTRMKNIKNLSCKLSKQLLAVCPSCSTPGWGKVDVVKGLTCSYCQSPTQEIAAEIFGCPKCSHTERHSFEINQHLAEPSMCNYCNP